jgi:hypothetical protein
MKRTLYIDADTILYASASQQQKNRCVSTHKLTGDVQEWESKTAFNNWIISQDIHSKDQFTFDVKSVLTGEPRFAFQSVKQKVDKIFNASYCDDFYVCIQGTGNFRNDYVTPYVEYKGHRVAKPILYQECFDYVVRKYGNRCIVSNGIETDDFVNIKAWESYSNGITLKDKSKCPYVIAYVDKDIVANGRGWYLNYNDLDRGVFWNNADMQMRNFFKQVLIGDTADNILGIEKLSDISKAKYGIKTNGVGPTTSNKILGECKTEKEMAESVVECYKLSWPNDWKQRLADNCFFLYLQREAGEVFNLDKFFADCGVKL